MVRLTRIDGPMLWQSRRTRRDNMNPSPRCVAMSALIISVDSSMTALSQRSAVFSSLGHVEQALHLGI